MCYINSTTSPTTTLYLLSVVGVSRPMHEIRWHQDSREQYHITWIIHLYQATRHKNNTSYLLLVLLHTTKQCHNKHALPALYKRPLQKMWYLLIILVLESVDFLSLSITTTHQYLLWATMGQLVLATNASMPLGKMSGLAVQFLTPPPSPL